MKMTLESFETVTETDEKELSKFLHGLGKWSHAVIGGITLDAVAINKPIERPSASMLVHAPHSEQVAPLATESVYVSGGDGWKNLYGNVVADGVNSAWVNRRG